MKLKVLYFPRLFEREHIELYAYSDSREQDVVVCAWFEGDGEPPTKPIANNLAEWRIEKSVRRKGAKLVELETDITYDAFVRWSHAYNRNFTFAWMGNNCSDIVKAALEFCGFRIETNSYYHYCRSMLATLFCVVTLKGVLCPISDFMFRCNDFYVIDFHTPAEIFGLVEEMALEQRRGMRLAR